MLHIPTSQGFTYLPAKNKKIAGNPVQTEKRVNKARDGRDAYNAEFRKAKEEYEDLVKATRLTPQEAAAIYWKAYGQFVVVDSMKTKSRPKRDMQALLAIEDDAASMRTFLGQLDGATAYSLHYHHLGLLREDAEPDKVHCKATMKKWRDAIDEHFPNQPIKAWFQVGDNGRVHVHIIASAPKGKLARIESKKVVQPLYEAEGFISYLFRPYLSWNEESLARRIKAERQRNAEREQFNDKRQLPRTKFTKGVGNKRTRGRYA